MEKLLSFENKESTEQKLIKLLKEKGIENAEARGLLDDWTREQEELVVKENKPTGAIELNLKRARLYFAAGFVDESFENFEAARTQAWNEHRDELYEEIMAEMDKLENELDG